MLLVFIRVFKKKRKSMVLNPDEKITNKALPLPRKLVRLGEKTLGRVRLLTDSGERKLIVIPSENLFSFFSGLTLSLDTPRDNVQKLSVWVYRCRLSPLDLK